MNVQLITTALAVVACSACGSQEGVVDAAQAIQLGRDATSTRLSPRVCSSPGGREHRLGCGCPAKSFGERCEERVEAVATGESYTCVLLSDASVECWGANESGQASPPRDLFRAITAGARHGCGLRSDGSVRCWGDNQYGQASAPSGAFVAVSAGYFHTCGLLTDGRVACWGDNSEHQSAPPAGAFSAISAGAWHSCALDANGAATCWGQDSHGVLSPPAGAFTSIDSGVYYTCGLRTDGFIRCWGDDSNLDQVSLKDGPFTRIASGGIRTIALRPDGSVFNLDDEESPPEDRFVSIDAGVGHACGVRADGSLRCWGSDEYGETSPPEGYGRIHCWSGSKR